MNNSIEKKTHYIENGNLYTQVIKYVEDNENPNSINGNVVLSVASHAMQFTPTTENLLLHLAKNPSASIFNLPLRSSVKVISDKEYESILLKTDPSRLAMMKKATDPNYKLDISVSHKFAEEQRKISAKKPEAIAQVEAANKRLAR